MPALQFLQSHNRISQHMVSSPMIGTMMQLCEFDFPGNALLKCSLVYQTRAKDYKSPYFHFVSCSPAGKNGNDKTYITDKHITFMLESRKLYELGYALQSHANAHGERYGDFVIWADPSKATTVSSETELRTAKRLTVRSVQDQKNASSFVVNIMFDRGKAPVGAGKDDSHQVITYTARPFEAAALASHVMFLATKSRELYYESEVKRAQRQYRGQSCSQ